ncbi:MAG TPA: GyrI-like domain-containing protein [Xanthobacteraceae bacterium]
MPAFRKATCRRVPSLAMPFLTMPFLAIAALIGLPMIGLAFAQPALAQKHVTTQSIDPFGQEMKLAPKTIVYVAGSGTWDKAHDTLFEAFKKVSAYLNSAGLKPAGPAMTIYTSTDDTGFDFKAAIPLAEAPKGTPAREIMVGQSPEGKALKFVHRGTYDELNQTYEAITNYLDEKGLDAKDLLIEEYMTDLTTTPEDKLVVNVLVPLKQ